MGSGSILSTGDTVAELVQHLDFKDRTVWAEDRPSDDETQC